MRVDFIEFRDVKRYPRMDRETVCFSASLFVDGVLEAYVSNAGSGGGNRYEFPPNKCWMTLDCVERRVAALDLKHVVEIDGETLKLDVDIELLSFLSV
jgi:hypothetical protein